jgi:hypoxanthine phosphoribosyltransferase
VVSLTNLNGQTGGVGINMATSTSAIPLSFHSRREPCYIDDEKSIDLEHFYIPAHYQDTLKCIMVPHGMIVDRVEKLACDISKDYNGHTIHLLCVLKGIIEFFS